MHGSRERRGGVGVGGGVVEFGHPWDLKIKIINSHNTIITIMNLYLDPSLGFSIYSYIKERK